MRPSSRSAGNLHAHPRAWLPVCIALLCVLFALCGSASQEPPRPVTEKAVDPYAVKAASLYKLALYCKWPEAALGGKDDPLRIAVFGADPFGSLLDTLLKGKKHGTHPVSTQRFATLEQLGECHVLFVPEKENANLPLILEKLKGRPVIVVCESIAQTEAGAGVGLYVENSRIAMAINQEALKSAHIEASSELLKLAHVIKAKKDEPAK